LEFDPSFETLVIPAKAGIQTMGFELSGLGAI